MPVYGRFGGVDLTAVDRLAADTLRTLGLAVTVVPGLGPSPGAAAACAAR